MKKGYAAFLLTLLLTLCAVPASAEHITWKDYFPEYKLSQLIEYKGSTPKVDSEEFWDMARERNVYGWADNRLISVMQLLEYAHDGNTNHKTYMRDLFLGHLYISSEKMSASGNRRFHTYIIQGDGITLQPLTIVFEVMDGGEEVLVECERPYKQEVAPVDHLDNSYGIKLFDYGQALLNKALVAIESGDPRTARSLVYGVNAYDSGNRPGASASSTTYPNEKIIVTFGQGAMPVYAGPGYNYDRLANGKATLGSDSWCYWYGNKGDWALVEYELSKGGYRVGWVYYPGGRGWQADTSAAYFKEGLSKVN